MIVLRKTINNICIFLVLITIQGCSVWCIMAETSSNDCDWCRKHYAPETCKQNNINGANGSSNYLENYEEYNKSISK